MRENIKKKFKQKDRGDRYFICKINLNDNLIVGDEHMDGCLKQPSL